MKRATQPMFNRQPPTINSWMSTPWVNDDSISIVRLLPVAHAAISCSPAIQNTQSGSQWDGLKHYGISGHNVFYNKFVSALFFPEQNVDVLRIIARRPRFSTVAHTPRRLQARTA